MGARQSNDAARGIRVVAAVAAMLMLGAACSDAPAERGRSSWKQTATADVSTQPFAAAECGDSFRKIELDHVVEVRDAVNEFDANGAGVAVGDLDDDGRPDIVLGNLYGPVRVFWNRGGLEFEPEDLGEVRSRSVQLVDVDADADLDIVLGPGQAPPVLYTNDGGAFTETALPGVDRATYSMAWLDADGDADLDLVTASYDMEFGRVVAREYIFDREEGVWFHRQEPGGVFVSEELAPSAHALAMTTADLDGDGSLDLVVGNDFGLQDAVWQWTGKWERLDYFSVTSANTMSYDIGDVDLDGDDDLYATDMAPYDETNAEFWRTIGAGEEPPGPQTVRNVLLDLGDDDRPDAAAASGIGATGWSWAGRLLDIDNDADLDLYVANGMLPSPLMPAEIGLELVETNLAFRNDGTGTFTSAPDWDLGATASTRGLATGDLDGDGDLDIVASTVGSPALVFVNEICDGLSVTVEPRWSAGPVVGTRVRVDSSGDGDGGGDVQSRTIRSGSGYLSADEPVALFGLGTAESVAVEVRWSDGETTVIDDVPAGTRITVER